MAVTQLLTDSTRSMKHDALILTLLSQPTATVASDLLGLARGLYDLQESERTGKTITPPKYEPQFTVPMDLTLTEMLRTIVREPKPTRADLVPALEKEIWTTHIEELRLFNLRFMREASRMSSAKQADNPELKSIAAESSRLAVKYRKIGTVLTNVIDGNFMLGESWYLPLYKFEPVYATIYPPPIPFDQWARG